MYVYMSASETLYFRIIVYNTPAVVLSIEKGANDIFYLRNKRLSF